MVADDTAEYFELHSRDYHPRRLRAAIKWIGKLTDENDDLFDVGCGTGLVLEAMRGAGVTRLAGCDTAGAALRTAGERVDFTPHLGSILDEDFVAGLGNYRFVTVAAVLHHVVGPTRRASRRMAEAAVRNSLSLVRPGGRLLIMEPTYRPRWAMTGIFWAKRVMGVLIGNRRLELGHWNNLGAPLVSYYSPDEVVAIVEAAGGKVIRHRDRTSRLRRLPRLLGVRERWFTTVMVVRGDG
jgi:SAM-dependent methyltransferase